MHHLHRLKSSWAILGNIFFISVIRSADVDVPVISAAGFSPCNGIVSSTILSTLAFKHQSLHKNEVEKVEGFLTSTWMFQPFSPVSDLWTDNVYVTKIQVLANESKDSILSILLFFTNAGCWRVEKGMQMKTLMFVDTLLCRRCGHEVTSSEHLNNIGSKLALAQRNDTIIGNKHCLIQIFKNPNGHHFELITTKKASITPLGNAVLEHSWFPKFAWRVAVCPQCGHHLGWSFEDPYHNHKEENSKQADGRQKETKTPYSFVGLIFPNLIKENYADSLIITPRAYRG